MPIAIILRTSGSINVFRDAVIDALSSSSIDEALLCSGFFQENFKGSAYQASTERQLGLACAMSGVKLTTVGIHNNTWKPSYQNFKKNMLAAGANIKCMYKPGMHWHAKVFIASSSGSPNFGIVGSSNITRNAFSTGSNFNNECDVFLWEKTSPIARIANHIVDTLDEQIIIRAPYQPRQNQGISLSQKLLRIRDEVFGQDLQELI
ncbi:hypothetical protein FMZ60_13950 [Alcaligenaceae bacterium SJ-26]|nr:hypothetical protein FMZ60_13950 [Alcaligenaceae bacterium SJ-26]